MTRNVSVPMSIFADGSSFTATGALGIKATDFGCEPYSAAFGALKNLNEMELSLKLVGLSRG